MDDVNELGELFAQAQAVGSKYLTDKEIAEHQKAMAEALADITAEIGEDDGESFPPGALRKAMIEAFDKY